MNKEKTNDGNPFNTKSIYNVSQGVLGNGAKKLKDYNFACYIGGYNKGFSQVTVNVDNSCIYYLLIKYVSYEPNLSFKINVNNEQYNKICYVDFSVKWSISSPLTYTIPVVLNSGYNAIEFYSIDYNKAPYIGEFIISLPPITNDLSMGILENHAYVDYYTKFVNAIGGPKDGSVTIAVKVNIKGIYNLSFSYSSIFKDKSLKISVNELDSREIYILPLTSGLNINNLATFTIPISFNEGINTIKFHGDGINYGANIGIVSIGEFNKNLTSILATSKTYKISSGTLGGGAFFDKVNNVVTNLGGLNDGYCEINVPVEVFGDYFIKLNYINNRPLRIDINGIETETVYNVTGNKKGIFSTTLSLVASINQLKFHGDGKNNAPDLGDFTIDLVKDNSPLAFLGWTSMGAKINSLGRVENLGGIDNGEYKFEYIAENFGEYAVYLTLDTSKANILLIDINKKNLPVKYKFAKNNVAKIYIVYTFLEKGSNILIFFGDYTNKAPDILKIEIKQILSIKDSIYYFSDGILEGGAVKNNNFIEGLGGINNGSVTIKVNILNEGLYDLNIKYTEQNIDSPLKIDVNTINTNTIYVLPSKTSQSALSLQSFKLTVNLNKGINNIKFYGNEVNDLPNFSYVRITKSLIKDSKPFRGTYNLIKGINGAEVDESKPGFFKGIGGKRKGVAVVYIEVPRTGEYELAIEYLKINDNEKIYIELEAVSATGELYNPSKTKSLKVEDAKTFTLPMVLTKGSILCFYGNDIDNSPLIGKITATEVKIPTIDNPCKITDVNLYNGAKKYKGEDFIICIGGKRNGLVILEIDVLDIGLYDLGFKYISGIYEKPLKVKINSEESINYKLPATNGLELINAETFTIPLMLKEKNNTVSLEGNGDSFAPIIGMFKIAVNNNTAKVTYNTAMGVFKNGARVNSYGLVTNIGGPKQGEVSVKVLIYNKDIYNLALEYKPIIENQLLEIVVNDIKYVEKCEEDLKKWSLVNMPILNKRIYLDTGYSTITFKGVENNYAPFLGKFILTKASNLYSFTQTLPKDSYDVKKGILENGANIMGAFVNNIGGILKGAVTIKVYVEYEGIYSMFIEYMAEEYSVLLFDVNGELTGDVYTFDETTDCNTSDVQEFEIKLKKGANSIKFYGVKEMLSPNLNIISLNFLRN